MVTSVVVEMVVKGSSLKGFRKPERAARFFQTRRPAMM